MYVVRPRVIHFASFFILLPLFIVEARALEEFIDTASLRDPSRTETVAAEVIDYRYFDAKDEIKYRFRINGDETWYSASDMTGRRELWIPIIKSAWAAAQQSQTIEVAYLPDDPWVNRPVEQAGHPLLDSLCGWGLLLLPDVVALFELTMIIRNFSRVRQAAQEGRFIRMRYWETRIKSLDPSAPWSNANSR